MTAPRVILFVDRAVQERRTVLVHRTTNPRTSYRQQVHVQKVIREHDAAAVATSRRVGNEWRVHVTPLDEAV